MATLENGPHHPAQKAEVHSVTGGQQDRTDPMRTKLEQIEGSVNPMRL
jgi:hypothetical protein